MTYSVLVAVYVYMLVRNVICSLLAAKWLSYERPVSVQRLDVPLYLLIPMMDEQVIARDTYLHFRSLVTHRSGCEVLFITTARERQREDIPHTNEVLRQAQTAFPSPGIHILHYEDASGVMAHQLNFAVEQLRAKHKDGDFWIGIYNADSRIDERVLDYVEHQAAQKGRECCFQQYSYFPLPIGAASRSNISSAAQWQNRWSVLFELTRVRYQVAFVRLWSRLPHSLGPIKSMLEIIAEKMNYVIGHGFYAHNEVLGRMGGFPEENINEDACLGYRLNVHRIPIYPVPILEQAEFTNRISVYIRQQSVWFNGPFHAFKYFTQLLHQGERTAWETLRAAVLATKLFLLAIYWLFSPSVLLLVLPIWTTLLFGWWGFAASILFILAYLPGVHYLIARLIRQHTRQLTSDQVVLPRSSLYCVSAYLIHCWGPCLNMAQQLRGRNNKTEKYKTQRNEIQHADTQLSDCGRTIQERELI
ncbi:glycosyltransferase [Paenibacillus massiliensis]|uniref:glycosyltransferase n=1 Tax=Paenibacillus massiliensis TaxID=225917 RepID=UPI00047114F6|nr:hypothetical protein [Paenibacillus massiliensis]